MKKIAARLALLAAVAGSSALALPAATAGATGTAGTVTAQDAYLRPYPQSWFVGTLRKGDHFDVQGSQSGYYWGYAQGSYNGCAWIVASSVDKGGSPSSAPDCGAPQRLPLPDSSHAPADGYDTDGDGKPDRLTAPYKITCPTALYGDYRGGQLLDAVNGGAQLAVDTPVGWRWTTSDGHAAAVRYDAGDVWAFVPTSCIGPR